jgi:hypothetical protein
MRRVPFGGVLYRIEARTGQVSVSREPSTSQRAATGDGAVGAGSGEALGRRHDGEP